MWYRAAQKGAMALKKELIHSRKIIVNCYETDTERLLVEGFLTDERLFPYIIHALREQREPGLMHHVELTMELTIPQLKIVSITAEMPVVPDAECRDIKNSVQRLEGHCIRPGFTSEARELFGKAAGCLHLTNLILAMSSAAVQGLWSYLSRVREGAGPSFPATDGSMLIDSCHMWRKEGPFVDKIRKHKIAQSEKRS
ncbi:MAG: hypothetical protein C0390_06420 [Syntrophus sp. (in: bacteria)]|nr:hypothetical protein [Syntrophus sp. (in: bacteria)]